MKKLLFIAVTLITMQTNAKIWRINNNPSLGADALQAATLFDGTNNATNPEANAGDSIYFEPSTTIYNTFNINKASITILAYGYLLNENTGLQAMPNNAKVNSINFLASSSGSSVSGVEINGSIDIASNNITITRCLAQGINLSNATNATGIRIDKCFIRGFFTDGSLGVTVTNITISIENCIFSGIGDAQFISGINLSNKVRGLFRNNIMNYCSTFYGFNFYVANNIFIGQPNFGTVSNSGNNVFRNNLFSYPIGAANYAQVGGNTAPNSNNLFSVNMANVFNGTTDNVYNGTNTFNNYILTSTFGNEGRFELKASSPAIAAGENGLTFSGASVTAPNCGAFGATDPYRKAGIPAIPTIYSLTIPPTVSNGAASMNISISSRSNN